MRRLNISVLRSRKKAIGITVLMIIASFSAGLVIANRVPIRDIQSLSGSRVLVPGAEITIVRQTWQIDAARSLVTGVNLLLFPNSTVWRVKLYEIFVQVSCLDPGPDGREGTADDVEFICSNGSIRLVMPSHWIGLRPVTVPLTTPVNPETTEIHDLSFIITDLNPVPQSPARIVGGAMPPMVQLMPGETKEIQLVFHGILGVPAGTRVEVKLEGLPKGVTPVRFDPPIILEPFGDMQVPHAMTTLTLTAAADAMVGEADATLTTTAQPDPTNPNDPCSQPNPPIWCRFADISLLEIEIIVGPVPPPPPPPPA